MKQSYYLAVIVTVLLFSIGTGCTDPVLDKTSQIDSLMQLYQELGQFNGTVLVAEKGVVIFKKGYGMANMEWEIPNEPDTKMRLGSITKQFTSMMIMQLVEEGKIDLQAPITRYLPDYRKETGDRVTIHHLLTHTSGIPSYTSLPNFFNEVSRDPYPVDEFIEKFCSGDLEFEPGTEFRYNNSGYFLLGAIIEHVTGKSYEEALHERVLARVGMNETGYDHHSTILKKRATGYERSVDGYLNSPYLDMSLPYAAGSLYSTVEDLYLWDRALYAHTLLSEENSNKMFTPFLANYAYGWGVGKLQIGSNGDSLNFVGHSGGINGFNTLITRLIDDQHLVVLLNNTGGQALDAMTKGIINILYGEPYELPKKSIGAEMYEKLGEGDLAAAIAHYQELKENSSTEYDFSETELNWLGYALMEEERMEEAIAIFVLNVKSYPESWNVYDSLGEAYANNGQDEEAFKNYKRSLELNPENTHAIEMIRKLNPSDE
jgi:CubicO group peptidase (beta-lactamase class C family)